METEVRSNYRQVILVLTLSLVGMIQRQAVHSAGIRSDDALGIAQPVPSFVRDEIEHGTTNREESSEPVPPHTKNIRGGLEPQRANTLEVLPMGIGVVAGGRGGTDSTTKIGTAYRKF